MKRICYAFFIVFLVLSNVSAWADGFQPAVEQLLVAKVNAYRASRGLPRLVADGRFAAAARSHAMDMARRNYLGHTSASGLDFNERMKAYQGGAMQFSTMGENAVMIYPPGEAGRAAERMFQSWLGSSSHRANMERRDFVKVATGAVFLNGKAYADQIFVGAPLPPASQRRGQSTILWQ